MMPHARGVADLISQQSYREVVEVGVLAAYFSHEVLQACNCIQKYWGVDPWRPYPGHPNLDEDGFDELALAVYAFANMEPRFHILRLPSVAASALFPEGSIDFIFIDGDHGRPAVEADIKAWFPKVRIGGIIAGHDYKKFSDDMTPPTNWGVYEAIHGLFEAKLIQKQSGTVWWVYKGSKVRLLDDTTSEVA